jgi:hypothetical protein
MWSFRISPALLRPTPTTGHVVDFRNQCSGHAAKASYDVTKSAATEPGLIFKRSRSVSICF